MPRSSRSTDDRPPLLADESGSAPLEFILGGLILLVPLVYLVVTLGLIQGQALGAESGARHIARAISTAGDTTAARERADLVLRSVVEDYGLDAASTAVALECSPAGSACPAAGSTIVVTIRARVTLPLVPPVLGLDRIAAVPIEASAAQKVSRFWGAG